MLNNYSRIRIFLPALIVVAVFLVLVQPGTAATAYSISLSESADRSAPVLLDGETVNEDVYVFTGPDTGVKRVSFYMDNPGMSGIPDKVENRAPYDLGGTNPDRTAISYDTTQLTEGSHSLTAKIELTDGPTEILTVNFSVANTVPALEFSAASLSVPVEAGASASVVSGIAASNGGSYAFSLSTDVTWLTVSAASGATPSPVTVTVNSTGLSVGTYFGTVTGSSASAASTSLSVTAVVSETPPPTGESSLQFNISAQSYALEEGEMALAFVDLAASDGAAIAYSVAANAPWISIVPETGTTPELLNVSIDSTGLGAGTHMATVTASTAGYADASLSVAVEVSSSIPSLEFNLQSLAFTLSNGSVGTAHSALTASDGSQAEFTLSDDASWLSALPSDGIAQNNLTLTVNSLGLAAGNYAATLTASAPGYIADNLTVNLIVNETQSVSYAIVNSDSPDRSNPVGLNGLTLSGDIYVHITPESGIEQAEFYLDDPAMTGAQFHTEGTAPFDFNSGNVDGSAARFDTTTLPNGSHNISVVLTLSDSSTVVLSANFDIDNRTGPGGLVYFAGDDISDTAVGIQGEIFMVNGTPVYEGLSWNGNSIEGLLLNARMVNGIYDDLDGSPPSGMLPWDPRANTDDFIANMQEWRDHGLSAFSINFQGGSNRGNGLSGDNQIAQVNNNPFGSTGTQAFDDWNAGLDTPHSRYLQRLGSIIRHADDLGMAVILGLFYFGQDEGLADEQAVVAAVDAATDWILDNGWTNVMIEITNEAIVGPLNAPEFFYQHDNLQADAQGNTVAQGDIEDGLITRVKNYCVTNSIDCSHLPAGRLLVSTSLGGGRVPSDELITASDFVLLHGNGQNAAEIGTMVSDTRASAAWLAAPKPIVFNEDSVDLRNFDAAIAAGAGWGYYDSDQYQSLYSSDEPDRWAVSRAPLYWNKVTEIATSVAPPPPPPSELPELVVSTNSDRSGAILLEGTALTGDVYVFITSDTGVEVATFFLDDPEMIGSPVQIEQNPPFDFKGGSVTTANPFDTTQLPNGAHTITARVIAFDGTTELISASFTVNN